MPNTTSLIQVKTKKRVDWKDMKVIRIPYDGAPNLQNPYDKLSPEEREKKIIAICRKIWLRKLEKDKTK
jgi:hypothetical protein